jgi:hypothetical protein
MKEEGGRMKDEEEGWEEEVEKWENGMRVMHGICRKDFTLLVYTFIC